MLKCNCCGAEVKEGSKFCPECGNNMQNNIFKKEDSKTSNWWKPLVGEYTYIKEVKMGYNPDTVICTIQQNGQIELMIDHNKEVLKGKLNESQTEHTVSLIHPDGSGFGTGHACQPACSAWININGKTLIIQVQPLPHPICYPGFTLKFEKKS